jgi:Immunity protein 50
MNIPTYILNHKTVVDVYGRWPSFHDAQVSAYVAPTRGSQLLVFTIHTWQMTNEVDAKGYFVLQKHALVSFRFDGIFDVEMAAFDASNILSGIEFFPASDGSSFRVVLDSVMDRSGSFSARKGEVVSVIPCTPDGHEA